MKAIIVLGSIIVVMGFLALFLRPKKSKKIGLGAETGTTPIQEPTVKNSFLKGFISFLKFFWGWQLIFFVILGLFIWFFFPQLKLWFKFKEVERAQIAKAIRPLEKRLDVLAEKAKNGEDLSDKEAVEMQSLKKEVVAAKKKVKEGPPPPLKPSSVKPKKEVIITKPVSNDLLTGAYLSWQKPDDYAGKKPGIREAVFEIKITRLDNEKLVFLDSNGKDTTDCTWKEKSQKYQGQWEKDGKVGFIEFTPIYKNGKIVSFCGAMGSKNKKPNSFCWITGDIP